MLRMDEMPSTEFRRRYATLLRPTIVTVNGHPIGVWQPHVGPRDAPVPPDVTAAIGRSFSSRPFTPVPKKR